MGAAFLSLLLVGSVGELLLKGIQAGRCFSCSNVQDITKCSFTTQCGIDEDCYTERFGDLPYARFNLGCLETEHCPRSPAEPFKLVGRALTSSPVANCRKCCKSDRCNTQLCDFQLSGIKATATPCTDKESNCSHLDTTINICTDISHAKSICRKTCGLCDLLDGNWNIWSGWSTCSVTCGRGNVTRTRTCSNPRPANGGVNCTGESIQTSSCNLRDCPVHGEWSAWDPWGSCSESCGIGLMNRHRTCTNPPPSLFGHLCFGDPTEYMLCNTTNCVRPTVPSTPVPHNCSDTVHDCKAFNDTFAICDDTDKARQICKKFCSLCGIVDGKWSKWTDWAHCSVTCGNATTSRTRTCSNPPPLNDGKACQGDSKEYSSCGLLDCPVHGGWTGWMEWADCSTTCGTGLTHRRRSCTNPSPSLFGTHCFGDPVVYNLCMTKHCPVDGNWNEWGEWSQCSLTCGQGSKSKVRTCSNPSPQYGGSSCSGVRTASTSCNLQICPVDGQWASWSAWSSCPDICNKVLSRRNRTCTSPSPSGAGRQCLGDAHESRLCSCAERHAFKVLQSKPVTYSNYTFLALEVQVPADGRSKTENWCRDYQLLCEDFSRRPTGCGVSQINSSSYRICHNSFHSDMAIADVLGCSPTNIAAAVNSAFPHLQVPAKSSYNTFGFYQCDPSYCQKTIQASSTALYTMSGFWGSGGTKTTTMYTVCH